jgi:hypothetical protein
LLTERPPDADRLAIAAGIITGPAVSVRSTPFRRLEQARPPRTGTRLDSAKWVSGPGSSARAAMNAIACWSAFEAEPR